MQIPHQGSLEEARRDESVSSSWEDKLSKTLDKHGASCGGGGGIELPTWMGYDTASIPSGEPWSMWESWVPDGRDTVNLRAGPWECNVKT